MSIILKGIDLPKEGEEITLAIFHDGDIVSYKYWLPKDAEAIQIPKGHRRLIDGDAFIRHLQDIFCEKCEQHKKYGGTVCRICNINDAILEYGDVPTILEAEE